MIDQNTETIPAEVSYIANHWRHLQPHVREAIMTLIDGALTADFGGTKEIKEQRVNRERTIPVDQQL